MSLSVKARNVIIAICVAILGIFVFGYVVGHKRAVSASNAIQNALNKEIERYVVELNNNKLYVSSVEQELETIKQAKAGGDISNKELRKLNLSQANEISRLKLSIDTLLNVVTNNGQIIVTYDTTASDTVHKAIKLPFTFDKSDKWLNLNGSFNNAGKLDISLKMDVPIDLITGIGKDKKPTAVLTSKNPYINVLSISSIKTDVSKPKKIGIGVFVGYGIGVTNPPKFAPLIGVGLSYNIFRF